MWNEYMEWEDEDEIGAVHFYEKEEYEARVNNPYANDEHVGEPNKALAVGVALAAVPLAVAGDVIGNAIANQVKKRRSSKNADKAHASTEWIRANIKAKQKAAETLQGDDHNRED